MGKKYLVLSTAFLVCVVGLWLTSSPPEWTGEPPPLDPAEFRDAIHLAEHGIHIGSATSDEILVRRENGRIRVEIRPHFLEELPEGFLSTLGWVDSINWVSDEGYQEFLDALDLPHHGRDENHERDRKSGGKAEE
jgi:hypothetical protein